MTIRGRRIAAIAAAVGVVSLATLDAAATGRMTEVRERVAQSGLDAFAAAGPEVPFFLRAPLHVEGHGAGSFPRPLPGSQVGGALLFEAGCLWRTDGTAAGTFQLGGCLVFKGSHFVLPVGPRKVFPSPAGGGLQLWATDGTRAGTVPLTDFDDVASLSLDLALTPDLGRMVFSAYDETNGREPWLTDGTSEGTGIFADLRPGPESSWPVGFSFLDEGRLLFFLLDFNGPPYEVWSSDLTAVGTSLAFELDVSADAYVSRFSAASQAAVFWVTNIVSDFDCELELLRTDGTAAGTYGLAGFVLPGCDGRSTAPVRLGDHRYFEADDGVHGSEVWRTDGSTLKRLTDARGAGPLSDETLRPVRLGPAVFVALDGGQGRELWRVDDAGPATAPLVDLCPGECSGMPGDDDLLTLVGGGIVFEGDDGVSGRELWFTDGSVEGTRLLADLCPGACSSWPWSVHAFDGYVLLYANDGSHGQQLWRVDLPSGRSVRLTDFPPHGLASGWGGSPLGRCLIFSGDDGVHGSEPWVSDGTRLGTHLIADLVPDGDRPRPLRPWVPGRRPPLCDSKRFRRSWWCPCVAADPPPPADG